MRWRSVGSENGEGEKVGSESEKRERGVAVGGRDFGVRVGRESGE